MSKKTSYINEIKTFLGDLGTALSWGIIFLIVLFIGIIVFILVLFYGYEVHYIHKNFNYMKKNNPAFLTFLDKKQKPIFMYKYKEPRRQNFFMVYQLNPTQYQTALQVIYKLKASNTSSNYWMCISPAIEQHGLSLSLSRFYVLQNSQFENIDRDSFITYQSTKRIRDIENSCKNKKNFIGTSFDQNQLKIALSNIGVFTPLTAKQSKRYDDEYGLFLDPQTHFLFFKTTY